MKKILVLNPNSSIGVTESMNEALAPLRFPGGPEIVCATLSGTPAGIETQEDVESVVMPVLRHFRATNADAYVIACFSDPALQLCREEIAQPVLGIAESAYLAAVGLGDRFGVVSIRTGSIGRHLRAIRLMGLEDKLAGDRAIDMGVIEMNQKERAIARIVEIGTVLRDVDGAKSLILGCASMGTYRAEIEGRLNMPIVDPVQAATLRAMGFLMLNQKPAA